MRCPYCGAEDSKVIDTSHDSRGGIRRRRKCLKCGERFSSYERAILATPLVVKEDGTREEFEREKLTRGIRISCAKRPVSAADIERLIGEIEATLQTMGKSEVPSRVIGDMVMAGLKELDHIAYIRYAIVYLRMDDLTSVRDEINRLLEAQLELTPVDSTLLEAVGYDAAMQELEVVFASGKTYRYIGVPRSVYAALLAAESKGRYMHEKVLSVYACYEVVRRR